MRQCFQNLPIQTHPFRRRRSYSHISCPPNRGKASFNNANRKTPASNCLAERGHSCPQQCVSPALRRKLAPLSPSEAAADRNVRGYLTGLISSGLQPGGKGVKCSEARKPSGLRRRAESR
jgi:hypothetical protein